MFSVMICHSLMSKGQRMLDPEKFAKNVIEGCEPIFKGQIAFQDFLNSIATQGHSKLGFFKRYRLLRSLSYPYDMWQHIQRCQECKPVLNEALKQIDIFSQTNEKAG